MNLDSVRALKAEAAETLIRPLREMARQLEGYAGAAATTLSVLAPQPTIALGVSTVAPGRDTYKLAVRLQDRRLKSDYGLLGELYKLSRGEIDVRYIGRIAMRGATWHRGRHRPLRIGSSVAHHTITAGTIGCFPLHRPSNTVVALSNAHIFALNGTATIGDEAVQPGPIDGGRRPGDAIGTLLAWAPMSTFRSNRIDAAICQLTAPPDDRSTLRDFGHLAGVRQAPIADDDVVFKIGRTTGLTRGRVTAIEMDDIVVDTNELGRVEFDDQIEIEGAGSEAFSDGGDSGSLVFDRDGFGVGLLFAGSDQGGSNGQGLTYANDLKTVMDALDLALDV